jgi:hypothetical protein
MSLQFFLFVFLNYDRLGLQVRLDAVNSVHSVFQEVLLKRAADLVEALYGMPHNNQVRQDTSD